MPPLVSAVRPVLIKLEKWSADEKREQWQRAAGRDLSKAAPGAATQDVLQALDMAGQTGCSVMCTAHTRSDGRGNPLCYPKPLRRVYSPADASTATASCAARAINAAAARLRRNSPCVGRSAAALGDVWGPAHREWTETWLRLLRRLSHETTEALTELRCTAVAGTGGNGIAVAAGGHRSILDRRRDPPPRPYALLARR